MWVHSHSTLIDSTVQDCNAVDCGSLSIRPAYFSILFLHNPVVGTLLPPTANGSCVDAGYQNCCIAGYCAGSPPTCSCDISCHLLGTCCSDIDTTCPAGSCAAAGYRACCTDGSGCQGSAGCYCDFSCTFFGDCCFDFEDLCPTSLGSVIGSCATAGYSTCCDDGSDCLGSPGNCKCDEECRDHGDCCSDIGATCPILRKLFICLTL